jgi:hypothetical protein
MKYLFLVAGLITLFFMAVPLMWGAMHWVLFGLVIWGACALLKGPPRRRYYEPVPPRPAYRAPSPHPAPAPVSEGTDDLPLDLSLRAGQIRHKAQELLKQAHRFPFASRDLYVVRATLDDYLPRTLQNFRLVPPESREQPLPNGKTPLQELKEQLRLLDSKLDEIAEDLQRENIDRLLANRRFLEERFGRVVI